MSILLLCGTIWAAVRERAKGAGVLAGLVIASKQYLLIIAPLVWLLAADRRQRVRIGLIIVVTAALVTLPVAFWHPRAFYNGVIGFHLRQPFRIDSLSFIAAFARLRSTAPSRLISVIVVIAAGAFSTVLAYRGAKNQWACVLSIAVIVLGLFAFSPQAFMNYYAFAYAALCAALATSLPPGETS